MSVQSVLFVHLGFLYGPSPHAPGEFMRGWEPLHPPAGAPPCTPGIYAELGAPAPPDAGAPPCTRVTFSPMRKSPKNLPEGYPLWVLPLGGIIIPPAARRAAPPRRTLHGELGAN